MDLCVKDGLVYTEDGIRERDIGIKDGSIEKIGKVESFDEEIDASGCLVLPGFVNAHTHAPMTLLRGYADDLPLEEWLNEKVWPVEANLTPEDVYAGAKLAALEMIKTGTTAFGDMYFMMDQVARVVEESGLRATLGYGMITANKEGEEGSREELETGVEFAREFDNTANGRVKAMITPHAPYTCEDWFIEEAAKKARDMGCVFHTHLSETDEEVENIVGERGVRPAWYLNELGAWDENSYVAHGVHLDSDEISLLAKKGVSVAHCPSANMKLASGAAPVGEMLSKGVEVAIGTDGPASNNNLDMLKEMHHAALLAKLRDDDASTLPASQAIRMATINGANALGINSGAIEKGRNADLALLDLDVPHLTPHHDLISHVVYSAKGCDVRTTIVGGKVLMEDREVKTLDERRIMDEAEEAAERLVAKAEN